MWGFQSYKSLWMSRYNKDIVIIPSIKNLITVTVVCLLHCLQLNTPYTWSADNLHMVLYSSFLHSYSVTALSWSGPWWIHWPIPGTMRWECTMSGMPVHFKALTFTHLFTPTLLKKELPWGPIYRTLAFCMWPLELFPKKCWIIGEQWTFYIKIVLQFEEWVRWNHCHYLKYINNAAKCFKMTCLWTTYFRND